MVLHGFDDDDGVVHDDADGQHQPEQRQIVQAEADGGHDGKRADDCHRHGHQRDDRRPPVLQEHQHNDGDQGDRLDECADHFVDRLLDERSHVEGDRVVDVVREAFLELLHSVDDALGGSDGVGIGQRPDGEAGVVFAVELASGVQAASAEFDPADVLDADFAAAGVAADDDLLEFGGVGQTADNRDRKFEGLAGRRRLLAEVAGGDLHVLLAHRPGHIRGS